MATEPRMKPASGEPSPNGQSLHAPARPDARFVETPTDAASSESTGVAGANADRNWLQVVIDGFEVRLLRYAARLTGDLERGRDVVQETFLRLCREPSVAGGNYLGQWLFTVCRRLAIDVRRKETRMSAQLHGDAVCDVTAEAASSGMERTDELGQVLRLLNTLPPNQQEVVRLKFQEEMSYKQIAAITQLSVTNVGYLLHTAVKTLRENVTQPGSN